jgi:hypothetical protein
MKLRLKLWLQHRESCGLLDRRHCRTDSSDDCRAMRDHAQRAMRRRRGLTRQGVVHVYSLHEAETRHDQHEGQGRALPEQRAFELANDVHYDRRGVTLPEFRRGSRSRGSKNSRFFCAKCL